MSVNLSQEEMEAYVKHRKPYRILLLDYFSKFLLVCRHAVHCLVVKSENPTNFARWCVWQVLFMVCGTYIKSSVPISASFCYGQAWIHK